MGMMNSTRRLAKVDRYADIQVELTQLIFCHLAPTVLLGGFCQAGTTALLAHYYGDRKLWQLALAMSIVALLRFVVVVSFLMRQRRAELTLPLARWWRSVYALFTFLYAVMLAIGTLYAAARLDMTAWMLCSIGSFALSAALGANIGMQPWIVFSWIHTMLGATAILFLERHENRLMSWAGTALILVFAVSLSISVWSRFDGLIESLRSRRKLRVLTEQDTLTGLVSRRHFQSTLATICSQHTPLAILFIDLDGFKQVNDSLGHAAGDTLLTLVSERLRSAVRAADVVARLGGDEFAILQSIDATASSAQHLAERINHTIGLPFSVGNQLVQIGASIGIRFAEAGAVDPDLLLENADEALYRVKRAGGGSFSFSQPDPATQPNPNTPTSPDRRSSRTAPNQPHQQKS